MKRVPVVLVGLLLVLIVTTGAFAQAARVVGVRGAAVLVHNGQESAAEQGSTVAIGDQLRVIDGSTAVVMLPDNSIVTVEGGSNWTYASSSDGEGEISERLAGMLVGDRDERGGRELSVRGDVPGIKLPIIMYPPPLPNCKLLEDDPNIRWIPVDGAQGYTVRLVVGHETTAEQQVSAMKSDGKPNFSIQFSALNGGAATVGTNYRIEVEVNGSGIAPSSTEFAVLSADRQVEIGQFVSSMNSVQDRDLKHGLLAQVYKDEGLYGELLNLRSRARGDVQPDYGIDLLKEIVNANSENNLGGWVWPSN